MDIFKLINSLDEDDIVKRLNLPLAKDGKSYLCPVCNNGCGRKGDGIKQSKLKGKLVWHCYSCGTHWNGNADFIAAVEGLKDTAELVQRLKELYPEYNDNSFLFSRDKNFSRELGIKTASENVAKDCKPFYKFCKDNYSLRDFISAHGGKWRGLTLKTLEEFGAMYHAEYIFGSDVKGAAVVLPYDDCHCVIRSIEGHKFSRQGENSGLYEPRKIKDGEIVFVTEGEIDCLSVLQTVGNFGINCIATGSANAYKKVVPEINKRFANAEIKPRFIVMFDNDDRGTKFGLKLLDELKADNYPAECFFLEDKQVGEYEVENSNGEIEKRIVTKVDANDLIQNNPEDLLRRLIDEVDRAAIRFEEQEQIAMLIKTRETQEDKGIRDYSIQEYFSNLFFADVALTAKYASRRTGFDNLDGYGKFERTGRLQIFLPGLYVLGALPATGKTTFVVQLLEQLAEQGEPCIYCSYEMSKGEIYSKMIARELFRQKRLGRPVMALSSADVRRGAGSGIAEVVSVARSLAKTTNRFRVLEISVPIVELLKYLEGIAGGYDKPPVIAIDYLQIIPHGLRDSKSGIDDIMLRLKDFQRNTGATVILISAFNRANGNDANFTSFRESSAIEYSADVIWALQLKGGEEEKKNNPRPIEFRCLKNRNGAIYDCYFNYFCANDCFIPCKVQDCGDDD